MWKRLSSNYNIKRRYNKVHIAALAGQWTLRYYIKRERENKSLEFSVLVPIILGPAQTLRVRVVVRRLRLSHAERMTFTKQYKENTWLKAFHKLHHSNTPTTKPSTKTFHPYQFNVFFYWHCIAVFLPLIFLNLSINFCMKLLGSTWIQTKSLEQFVFGFKDHVSIMKVKIGCRRSDWIF